MSLRELVRQLNAVKSARPIHRYSTLHMRIDSNPMLVAFVRMAGESRPWAIAYGRLKDETPIVLSVPDGRNRIAVSEMCEEFAEDFLEYFGSRVIHGAQLRKKISAQARFHKSGFLAHDMLRCFTIFNMRIGVCVKGMIEHNP